MNAVNVRTRFKSLKENALQLRKQISIYFNLYQKYLKLKDAITANFKD